MHRNGICCAEKHLKNSRKDQRFEYTVELLGYMREGRNLSGKRVRGRFLSSLEKDFGSDVSGIWRGNSARQNGELRSHRIFFNT